MLFPPTGAESGAIRYDERKAPLLRASAILHEQLEQDRAFVIDRAGTWERMLTIEGEHAAAITIVGAVDGRPIQRDFGIVFLDDAYALTGGYCLDPESFALFATTVRELARGDAHLLGIRRRRFEYTAPEGWQARARGFVAQWFPRDYPTERARITVWPALPSSALSAEAFVDRVAGEATAHKTREACTIDELRGYQLVMENGAARCRVIVVEDDRYTYGMRLDATTHVHDGAFEALARSMRPVPRPAREAPPTFAAHWVE